MTAMYSGEWNITARNENHEMLDLVNSAEAEDVEESEPAIEVKTL